MRRKTRVESTDNDLDVVNGDNKNVEIRCSNCYYFQFNCRAFPHGIPSKIITGEFIHDKVYPGQLNKFIFKLKE